MKPNVAALGNWMASWVNAEGAIYGFHNHSVWGDNPYRWNDYTSGHTTWASPFLIGLAMLLKQEMNEKGRELLSRMIAFQTSAFQPNGEFAHVGFQVGETLQWGLIHNVHTDVSLALTAMYGQDYLTAEEMENIRLAILRNLEACRRYGEGRPDEEGTCNQEYARVWAKLLFQIVYRDDRWKDEIPQDLDFIIDRFHVRGMPDDECEGTLRTLTIRDVTEPAEYYGLMIAPLVLAYEVYGDEKYLRHAGALCKHIVRSAWTDSSRQSRVHRFWVKVESGWRKVDSPMLIAGMGHTLYGIARYLEHTADEQCKEFIRRSDATYAYYQNPRGYFTSATGWLNESDVAPSTGWHAHDFYSFAYRHGINDSFWETFWKPYERTSILLGDQCFWIESGKHWAIGDYFWLDTFKLFGRKDEPLFGRECPSWIDPAKSLPDRLLYPGGIPDFLRMNEGIYLKAAQADGLDITSVAAAPYKGLLR
ncbi:hypothetical protein [Paenibacillus sp. GCM10027626]|uniref:hypothetical protein n=1 Tax=Paenibacillus sp. GCM10027626 TaxID=3273411 RepID=UPI00362DCE6A